MMLRTSVLRVWRPMLCAGAIAVALSGSGVRSSTLEARQLDDAQVKAAFVFNLAKFVHWPVDETGPLVIGIAGDNRFADVVAKTVLARNVNGRSLETRRLAGG